MARQHVLKTLLLVSYISARYQLIRFYVAFPYFYLRLPEYFSGHERLPFQQRVLPIVWLYPLGSSRLLQHFAFTRAGSLHNPWRMAFFIASSVFFTITCYFTLKLYRLLSRSNELEFLVIPTLFYTFTWTYVLNVDQHYSYPYDVPSLAFFTAGLCFIYQRRFIPLFTVVLIGTFNREVTLFLVGLFILDGASAPNIRSSSRFRERFDISLIPWKKGALLFATWLLVYSAVVFRFRYNDRSEAYSRLSENALRLANVSYWPAELNISGFLLPFVVVLRRELYPKRVANYLYIVLPWVAVMFYSGVLNETRVYGELCPLVSIAIILIAERHLYLSRRVGAVPSQPDEVKQRLTLRLGTRLRSDGRHAKLSPGPREHLTPA